MFKKKALVFSLIGIFIVLSMLSTASAHNNFGNRGPVAFGVGTFVHEHEGVPHNHYFKFSVSDGHLRDSWYYKPDGKFFLVATHENEIHMIAKSDRIQRFQVNKVEGGGLNVVFEGVATVKHMGADWQKGWKFTVEAFDFRSKGDDSIHIMFTAPDGTEHHMEGTTLTSGNILIKK